MLVAVIVAVAVGLLAGAAIGRTLGARHHSDATPRSAPVSDPGAASPPGEQVTAGAQQPAEGVGDFGPLAEAVERISQGIVVMDGEGVVVYRNAMARRIAVSRHSRSLVEECVQRLLEDAREGQSHSETVELFGPPAELFGVSAHPFRDGSGIGAMAVVEDHSEIRRTETVRRDFVANISHELKTPIGALGLLAETIEDEDDPEVMKRLAERMVTESDRAARTIDEALAMAAPAGLLRPFLDEGDGMAALLRDAAGRGVTPDFVQRLLAAFGDRPPPNGSAPPLLDPLSARERDVLALLTTDLTGPEIAREMMVSLNTVRTHTKNIYSKLGVNSRRAAVRRAAELALV